MPIYEYICDKCKGIKETIQLNHGDTPECCGIPMRKLPTTIAMFKMKGMGGYPSLRKAVQGGSQYYNK
jgi:putative FmdB family regulatory protein